MKKEAFRKRTAIALAVVCTISLVGLGLLAVFGPELKPTRSGEADVYSMSGVGHGALLDVLDELEVPTAIHRDPEAEPLVGSGVLMVLEPHPHLLPGEGFERPGLRSLIRNAHAAFLALPKWQVRLDRKRQPWVTAIAPLERDEVLAPLAALEVETELLRLRVPVQTPVTEDRFDVTPVFPTPYRQYIRGDGVEPLVADMFGTLLGRIEIEGTPVFVLSDPDLLANHGLHRGENATMVVRWLERLRDGGPVVFDETLHGFPPREESLLRHMFRFPLVLVLMHVVAVAILVLWAGLGRFGDTPPPTSEIEPGSGFLIRHTAWLLEFGKHGDMALRRYTEDVARDVATRFHLPSQLTREQRDTRLNDLGASRGTSAAWIDLRRRALAAAAAHGPRRGTHTLRAAHDLHRWKQEILHGPRSDS